MAEALKDLAGSNRPLRRLELAWFVFNLAEWAYVMPVSIYSYRTHGALALGLIGARFAPAALLGSLLVGAVAHRSPTLVLRLISLGRCLAVAAAAAAVATNAPLVLLVAAVWLDAVIAAPFRPVQSAMLPALSMAPRELSLVAGRVPASKALAQAAGALAGTVALTVVSPQAITLVAAVVFLSVAVIVAPLRPQAAVPLAAPAESEAPVSRRGRYRAVLTGFEVAARRARPLLLLGGTRSLTRGLWTSLAVVASIRLLHLGNSGVGLLMAAAGVGAAAAVTMSSLLAGREQLAGPAALVFALAGIPISLLGGIAVPAAVVILMVAWGTAFALADSISNSLIHRVVDSHLLAPSVAAIESSKLLLEGLGALAAPGLVAILGVRAALIVAGAPLPLLVAISRGGLLAVDRRAETRSRPLAALRHVPSFRGLTMLSLEDIASRLQHETVGAGSVIVRQGDLANRFYLIEKGRAEVTIDGYRITVLGPGASFGEKALLRAVARSATVTALEPTELWCLDGRDFVAAVTGIEGPVAHRLERATGRSLEEMLGAIPLFAAIDRRELADLGGLISSSAGEEIVRQGDPADKFYVLLEGEADASINGDSVRTLEPGDSFGEIALLHGVPRTATVKTVSEAKLWAIGREAFLASLGEWTPANAPPVAVPGVGILV